MCRLKACILWNPGRPVFILCLCLHQGSSLFHNSLIHNNRWGQEVLIWILTPECQSVTMRFIPEWQNCIIKTNRMVTGVFSSPPTTYRPRPSTDEWGLSRTCSGSDRRASDGTAERWPDSPITTVTSPISITPSLSVTLLLLSLFLPSRPSSSFPPSLPVRRQSSTRAMKCVTSLSLTPSN